MILPVANEHGVAVSDHIRVLADYCDAKALPGQYAVMVDFRLWMMVWRDSSTICLGV